MNEDDPDSSATKSDPHDEDPDDSASSACSSDSTLAGTRPASSRKVARGDAMCEGDDKDKRSKSSEEAEIRLCPLYRII